MSQRENNIIQTNALNDQRYHDLKNQLTDIYENTRIISPVSPPSIQNYSRIKNLR
jgi:hypothetical protein